MGQANKRQVGGNHYKQSDGKEEHWDRVARLNLDYFQACITKYIERWKLKGGVEDLQKARHYLDKYIELQQVEELTERENMTPQEYQKLAARTECDQEKARLRYAGCCTPDCNVLVPVRLNHSIIGMVGEVGELAALAEKHLHYGQPLDRAGLKDELGDVLWYVVLACNTLGLDLGEVMEANIAKLRQRYPNSYTDEQAAIRNRAAERLAQENIELDVGTSNA